MKEIVRKTEKGTNSHKQRFDITNTHNETS